MDIGQNCPKTLPISHYQGTRISDGIGLLHIQSHDACSMTLLYSRDGLRPQDHDAR
jgi:hypothetical protein